LIERSGGQDGPGVASAKGLSMIVEEDGPAGGRTSGVGRGERHRPAVPGTREFVAVVAGCVAMAAISIDLLLPAFADIRAEYGLAADSTAPSRLITSFFLGLAVGQLVYGPLSDRLGRKPMLYAGLAVYVVGALGAVLAPTFTALVACRFLWGLGAAAPRSLAVAMVRDSYSGERMARTMSHVMATFILVPVFAPTVGAGAIALAPWRVVFWIPMVAAVLVGLWSLRLPETLPPERRRSVSPRALTEAVRVVVTTRETFAFGLAVTALFGIMTGFVGGAEMLFDDVFGQRDLFPLLFGIIACMLGAGNVLSGRLVMRLGLDRLVRFGACYVVATSVVFVALVLATDGRPPLWSFVLSVALFLPGAMALVPSCNTAAMAPVPHVAGMAAAILGALSTGGGALLGSVVDGAFDGTVRPFALWTFGYAVAAALAILVLARRVEPTPDPTWADDEPVATAT
jgi:DHA1 family bicyclomycin/chloramphenicol resistance-like MFS transporter